MHVPLMYKPNMRNTILIKFIVPTLALLITGCVTKEMENVRDLAVQDVDLQSVTDGSYPGSFAYGGFTYQVLTTVKDHTIVNIDIIQNKKSRHAAKAEAVIPLIVEHQSPNVDGISGASISSKALKKAVENSLLTGQIRK
jgi:uncharacterized protein with FMN-binding domain